MKLGFLLLALLSIPLHGNFAFASPIPERNRLPKRSAAPTLELTEIAIEQRLGPNSSETFPERAFYAGNLAENDQSPVIFYVSGEWELSADEVDGYTSELARELRAHVVGLEHRFYGTSSPTRPNGLTSQDLQYLSVEHAVEDLAFAQKKLANDLSLHGPWFVIGISYAATLATYYRLAHPELVGGAVSFSAPLQVTENGFNQYEGVAVHAFGPELALKTRQAASYILSQNSTAEGRAWIQEKFSMPNSDFSTEDVAAILVTDIPQIAQFGEIERLREAMSGNLNDLELAEALIHTLATSYLGPQFWKESPYGVRNDPTVSDRISRWCFQAFTQFGWLYVTSQDPDESFLPSALPMGYYEREYARTFGGAFTSLVYSDYARLMQRKLRSTGSRIVLLNGSEDPWSAIGLSDDQDSTRDISSFMVTGGSHGVGLPFSSDPSNVGYSAGQHYLEKIRSWISN